MKIITLDQAYDMWVNYGEYLTFSAYCGFLKRQNYIIY
jgi:hypothetical protein